MSGEVNKKGITSHIKTDGKMNYLDLFTFKPTERDPRMFSAIHLLPLHESCCAFYSLQSFTSSYFILFLLHFLLTLRQVLPGFQMIPNVHTKTNTIESKRQYNDKVT